MKSSNGINVKIVDLKGSSIDEVGLLVQVVLTEVMIIFAILSLLIKDFMNAFYIMLSLNMFTLAYNNKKVYKKKNMTAIYIIIGLFIIMTVLVEKLL